MTALLAPRHWRKKSMSVAELAAAASNTYYQGALVGFDTSTGLLIKGQPSTTFWPIGVVAETKVVGSGGGTVLVHLFRELWAWWFVNDTTVTSAMVGGLCYVLDDQTVSGTDGSNTRSVMGRVWAVDAAKGVLVEPVYISTGDLSGVDS